MMTSRSSPQHTPGKLTLFKSPGNENTNSNSLERPLAEVIDQAFSPDARRRLVVSLKRREADHQAALEAQKAQMEKAKKAEVQDLLLQIEKAEACHQHVLDQFEAYKRNLAEEQMRSGKARDDAQAEADQNREAQWTQELEAVRQDAQAAKQTHEAATKAASDAHAAAMATQAATLTADFEQQMQAWEAELKAEGQQALNEAVARAVAEEKSQAAVAKANELADLHSAFTEGKSGELSALNAHLRATHEADMSAKLTALEFSLTAQHADALERAIATERANAAKALATEKQKAEETLHQVALAAGEQKLQLDALMGRAEANADAGAPARSRNVFRNYAVPSGDEDANVTRAPPSPQAAPLAAAPQQQQKGLPLAYLVAACVAALAFALTNSAALASILRGV